MANEEVLVTYEDGLQIITFNRPKKLNSIPLSTYESLTEALKEAVKRDDVKMTVVTGAGAYFSAGNDFSNPFSDDMEGTLRKNLGVLSKYINTLIDHPKLLVAIVNGPAVGIAVTMLSLFDLIYASESATFHTPFSSLGLCAEGCSSYMFPRLLGTSLAAKMLYFNYKMSAKEAKETGFVAELFNDNSLPKIYQDLKSYTKLPLNSLMTSKRLIRMSDRQALKAVNAFEQEALVERFLSEDFLNAMMEMMSKRSKSKL
uniref:Enoyl-CoA delta isomerase 2, mitochondrial n=2 Tax=Lygus hesperus TaxID=30085 RepID=A0A0A9WST2_LYGHE